MYFAVLLLNLLCFFGVTLAEVDAKPIVVALTTENKLLPLSISPFFCESNDFSADYVKSLEKILHFDFNYNGMTQVVALKPAKSDSYNSPFEDSMIAYAIKVRLKDGKLDATVWTKGQKNVKALEGLALTGNLTKDRRKIHELSDAIYKALFNQEGVATRKIIYTLKLRKPHSIEWNSEVFESDYDGGNAHQITRQNSLCVTPCYIPPKANHLSRNFAFVSYLKGQPKIYLASLDNDKVQRFSLLRGNQLMPAITRQRDKMAFISDATGNPDLFLQVLDPETAQPIGKPSQIFAAHLATQASPTFSPDGKKIAFVSNKDGSTRIYTMNIPAPGVKLKDIQARLLTKQNRENSAPCWSPDGKKIAYCAMTKGVRQIWIYDLEKNQEKQLTYGSGHKENPAFAPNSQHLIFNASDGNNSDLYLIHLNHKEAVRITSGVGSKHFPSWNI